MNLRPKLNMDDPKDVEAWDALCQIEKTPFSTILKDFVGDMQQELTELEGQILTIEKQRLNSLNDKVLRKQCRGILDGLRKDRDELRQTLGNKTYQRVDTGARRRDL